MSGPVGLGFAAAGVAASFLLMSGNSNKAKDALDDQGLSVDELREKYSKLNAEQLKIKALDAEDLKAMNLKNKTSFYWFISRHTRFTSTRQNQSSQCTNNVLG